MTNYPVLNKNPIVEAILEIKFELPSNFNIGEFKKLTKLIENNYPKHKEIFQNEITIHDNKSNFKSKSDGFKFFDKENHKSFTINSKQFDFFKTQPYDNWNVFTNEALLIWESIIKISNSIKIKQVSTRFINRIEVPNNENLKVDDYFKTFLNISDNLQSSVDSFFIRYTTNDNISKTLSHINLTVDNNRIDFTAFILDIDVLTTSSISFENLSETLELLRTKKDEIFFNTITDKTLNLLN